MKRFQQFGLAGILISAGTVLCAQAQSPGGPPQESSNDPKVIFNKEFLDQLDKAKKAYDAAKTDASKAQDLSDAAFARPELMMRALGPNSQNLHSAVSQLEQSRIDKQVGSTAASAGSTSLASKGSVPALLGFALENGGATQTTSGSMVTFQLRPAGIVDALVKKSFLASGATTILAKTETETTKPASRQPAKSGSEQLATAEPGYRLLNAASLALSFDTSKGSTPGTFTGTNRQLSAYSFRFDIVNHRDPRDPKHKAAWDDLRYKEQEEYVRGLQDFARVLVSDHSAIYHPWLVAALKALEEAPADKVSDVFFAQVAQFVTLFREVPAVKARVQAAETASNAYFDQRTSIIDGAAKSRIVTFEFDDTRQAPASMTTGTAATGTPTPSTPATPLPDIADFKLIYAGRMLGDAEFTLNGGATVFRNIPAGSKTGRVRDYLASAQIDIPLPKLSIGAPTLSFSGEVLRLMQQPLGVNVAINGQNVDARGTYGYAQARLEIPTKNSGLKIPISATWASKQNLVTETKKWGANLGLSFDLDKLLSSK